MEKVELYNGRARALALNGHVVYSEERIMAEGEGFYYTIIDQRDEHEAMLFFRKVEDDKKLGETDIALVFPGGGRVKIDPTQLTELGALLIALGGGKIDHDDVGELFDGYGIGLKLDVHETIIGETI